jgi:hypothetical protein
VASDAAMAPNLMLAQFIADASGNVPADIRDAVVIYQTQDDKVGALSYTCCNDHAMKLCTYGLMVMIDDPQPPRADCDPG